MAQWRRLGRVQKQILKVLNTRPPDPDSFVYTTRDRIRVRIEGWFCIDNVVYHMLNEFDEDGNLIDYHEATVSERICIWSAIRQLERRGLIEAMILPVAWSDRFLNMPKHCGPGYYGKDKRGHSNRKKLIRLVPQTVPIGLDDHRRGRKRKRKTRVIKRGHSDKKKAIRLIQRTGAITQDNNERGKNRAEDSLINTHSDHAIVLILAFLKEKATRQPSGFQVSSRAMSKALGKHFDLDYGEVWRLTAFVIDALVARGILQPFNTTTKRVVFRVGPHTPLGSLSHA